MDLINRGIDLSKLNPKQSDLWCKNCPEALATFPNRTELDFKTYRPSISGMFRFSGTTNGEIFNVIASLDTHPTLLRYKILSKLGYRLDPIKYYPQVKINFNSIKDRDQFIDNLSDYTLTSRERWIVELPKDLPYVILQDLILETGRITKPQYHWGIMKNSLIGDRRVLRTLLIPFVLFDLGESINLFSWDVGRIISKEVILTHPYAEEFFDITGDDAKWMVREIAKLSLSDLKEIIRFGEYPFDVAEVLLNKIIARRNQLIKLFKLQNEFNEFPFIQKINIGTVVDGKITLENYPGYAIRFRYDEPDAPLRFGEVTRFLLMKGISSAIFNVENFFNGFLNQDVQEAIKKHQIKEIQNFIEHLQTHPNDPYVAKIKGFVMPVGGVSINANRDIVSGTFYGSEYPVQLVDSFSVSGQIGLFSGMDYVPYVTPGLGVSTSVSRNYIHIRPIDSIKTGMKINWGRIFVPFRMNKLGNILNENPNCLIEATPCNDNDLKGENKSLEAFLAELVDGESFMISDSVSLGGNLSANIPILALMGIPTGAANLQVSAGGGHTWLRKITFERTSTGIKIYIQHNKELFESLGLSLHFLTSIYSSQWTFKQADSNVLYFKIELVDLSEADKKKAISSIRSLFKTSSTKLIKEYYPHFKLDNDFKSRIANHSILFYQWDRMRYKHEIKLQPPKMGEIDFDPKKHERVLYQEKMVNRHGANWYNMLGKMLNLFTGSIQVMNLRPNENPANTPFGRGKSFSVLTQGEITDDLSFKPVTMIEDVFSGWSIRKNKLFKVFSKIEEKIKGIKLDRNLFNRDVFHDTKKIQLFEVRTTLLMYPSAFLKLKNLINHKNELTLYNGMISFIGLDEFKSWCEDQIQNGFEDVIRYQGEKNYQCMMPWMMEMMDLRKKLEISDKKKIVHQVNQLYYTLIKNTDWDRFLNFLGDENFVMLVKVGGFRVGDDGAINQEGMSEYVSDTIGEFNEDLGAGVFRDFMSLYGISGYQMNASYFSEGF